MSHDTLIHRAVRPLVRIVAPIGVTPNQLTTLRLLTGLASGVGFAKGGAVWPDLGAAALLVSLLLDRADGELARQTGKTSVGGYRYDLICDCIATVVSFLGMGIGSRAVFGPVAALVGVVAGVGVGVVFFELNVIKLATLKSYTAGGGRALADPDDAMMLAPVLIWLGLMPWTVALAAAATPVVAVILALLGLQASRRTRARA